MDERIKAMAKKIQKFESRLKDLEDDISDLKEQLVSIAQSKSDREEIKDEEKKPEPKKKGFFDSLLGDD